MGNSLISYHGQQWNQIVWIVLRLQILLIMIASKEGSNKQIPSLCLSPPIRHTPQKHILLIACKQWMYEDDKIIRYICGGMKTCVKL